MGTDTATTKGLRGPVLEVLQALLAEQRTDEVVALVAKLVQRNGELEKRLSELLSRHKPREGVSTAQLKLLLDELMGPSDEERKAADDALRSHSGIDDKVDEPKVEPSPRQPRLRRPVPEGLRRVPNPITVPDAERPCPQCGGERACIGHDVTEVVDLIPAEVIVRLDSREKLACERCEGELVRAPLGDKVVGGGKLGSRLVAELLIDKYDDGLPLHRQKQRYERMGLSLPVSTLADQVRWSTELLAPLWRGCMRAALGARVMHLDGTGLPVLDRDHPRGKRLGQLWGCVGDREHVLYVYNSTGKKTGQRPGELGPEDLLKLRRGYTVADAASVFDASFARDDLVECGCNMHARRYFVKALDGGDKRAALPLAAFKKLYEVEAECDGLDDNARLSERQARSRPVYEELVHWCTVHEPHEPPQSPLGKALRYLLNHKQALMRFLEDGCIPIDNGIVERLHVRAALTRKNFLFAGSDEGGERAAIVYTILGTCRLAGVNPRDYLADVLPRLARGIRTRDIPDMLPARWKALRDHGGAAIPQP